MRTLLLGIAGLWLVSTQASAQTLRLPASEIDFGEDSVFGNDGRCADPRFEGAGMASGDLSEYDLFQDGADCQAAYLARTIRLIDDSTAKDTTVYAFEDDSDPDNPFSLLAGSDGKIKSVNELIGIDPGETGQSDDEDEWDLFDDFDDE